MLSTLDVPHLHSPTVLPSFNKSSHSLTKTNSALSNKIKGLILIGLVNKLENKPREYNK